jgi:hypothetical protein
MALLTLETEHIPCHWPAIEDTLARCLPGLKPVSQSEAKRTYQLNLADQDQPIPLFQELQTLLCHGDINFFIDLRS